MVKSFLYDKEYKPRLQGLHIFIRDRSIDTDSRGYYWSAVPYFRETSCVPNDRNIFSPLAESFPKVSVVLSGTRAVSQTTTESYLKVPDRVAGRRGPV